MDGKDFQGRLVHIMPAADKGDKRPSDETIKKKSLKETALDKRKANAGQDFNWAMLYMNVRVDLQSRPHDS